MGTQPTKAEEIIRANAGGEAVGQVTWWSLSQATYSEVNGALRTAGILPADADDVIKPPANHVALRRAVAHVQTHLDREAEEGQKTRVLIRPVVVTATESRYAILRENLQDAQAAGDPEFTHTVDLQVRATKDEDMIATGTGAETDGTVARIKEEYVREITMCPTHSISRVLTDLTAKGAAISLRTTGGVYFFPGADNDCLRMIETLLEALPACMLYSITVHPDGNSMASVAAAAEANFLTELRMIKDRVESMTGTRKANLKSIQVDEIADFRNRVALYRSLLGGGLSDVDGALTTLETLIEGKISAPLKATEEQTTIPVDTEAPASVPEASAPAPADEAPATPTAPAFTPAQEAEIQKWRGKIEKALDQAGPYSHNICSLALAAVAKAAGIDAANALVIEYSLDELYGIHPIEAA